MAFVGSYPVHNPDDYASDCGDESDIHPDVNDDIPTNLESNLAELASGLAELERECAELLATELCPEDEALLLASLAMVFERAIPLPPCSPHALNKCEYSIITAVSDCFVTHSQARSKLCVARAALDGEARGDASADTSTLATTSTSANQRSTLEEDMNRRRTPNSSAGASTAARSTPPASASQRRILDGVGDVCTGTRPSPASSGREQRNPPHKGGDFGGTSARTPPSSMKRPGSALSVQVRSQSAQSPPRAASVRSVVVVAAAADAAAWAACTAVAAAAAAAAAAADAAAAPPC
jgi:hypothetical protein